MSIYKNIKLMSLAAIILLFVACQAQEQEPEQTAEVETTAIQEDLLPEQIFTLGDISSDPAETIESFSPLANHLASELSEFGIQEGSVVVAPDLSTMLEYLESGVVDLYFDSPFPALTAYEEINAMPLARRWKGGVGEYHTVIVVHQDSGITDIEGLAGALIAFEEPVSTSGYFLPAAFLVGEGYQLIETDLNASVDPDEIGYVFAGSEENILAWVLEGKTAGATLQSDAYDELDPEMKSQLVVIARTSTVPRHIAVSSPGMDAEMQQQLAELLTSMHTTSEGQALLETFEETTQFDALPEGEEGTMVSLQQLFAPVR